MKVRKKIAIILSRFPYPLDKGDKLRAYHQIKYISQFHDVYLYALSEENVGMQHNEMIARFCEAIQIYKLRKWEIFFQTCLSFLKRIPVQVGYFYSPKYNRQIRESILDLKPDTIYCQLSRTALYAKDLPFKKVMDFQDAFSINYERVQNHYSGWMKIFYRRESRCMKLFEQSILQWFDKATIISTFDKQKIITGSNSIVVVSNGVDTNHFQQTTHEKTVDILFAGNLSYLPNKKAVQYLVEQIAPKLIKKKPQVKIEIVGSSGDELKKYESKNVHIRGWVHDVRQAYDTTKIFVAPLFTGAGLQNKLLEAMSMGVPCVTTSITNASLCAIENEQVLIANNENEFVEKIVGLLDDEALHSKLKSNARQFVIENYSWDRENQKLVDLL